MEEQDILRAIWMAELLGCPLYIPHVTIGAAIDAAQSRQRNAVRASFWRRARTILGLTADHEAFHGQRAGIGKVSPPLRDTENQDRLWAGLASGDITTVGSDHVPIEKSGSALWEERPGFAGMATILPALITFGLKPGRISIEKIAEVTSFNPARIFGYYPQKGMIAVGSDADFAIVDLNLEKTVNAASTPQPLHERLRRDDADRLAHHDDSARRGHLPGWRGARVAGHRPDHAARRLFDARLAHHRRALITRPHLLVGPRYALSTTSSSKARPTSCKPIGSPSAENPHGTEIAGNANALNGTVSRVVILLCPPGASTSTVPSRIATFLASVR